MMLLDEIKKANIQAMKDKNQNARAIFSVIMNKALLETVSKRESGEQLTDANMVSILQKTVKELIEESENYKIAGNQERVKLVDEQRKIAESFLPQMMSQEEINQEISKLQDKSIPSVMRKFKADFAGKCDMRLVQETLKKYFN